MNDHPQTSPADADFAAGAGQPTSLPGMEPVDDPHAASSAAASLPEPPSAADAGDPAEAAGSRRSDPRSSGATLSKSQRVRDYLRQHPAAKNKDVAAALAGYGVSAADVANVKSQLKRKQQGSQKGGRRGRSTTAAASAQSPQAGTASAAQEDDQYDLSLSDLERVLAFVRQIGSIQRARKAIDLLEQIRQIQP